MTLADIQAFPKIELHRHIDGAIPGDVMRRIALREGVREVRLRTGRILSVENEQEFERFYQIYDTESIDDLLARFDFVIELMQTPELIEELVYEAVCAASADNIRHVEWTLAPAYHTRQGLSYTEAITASLRGLYRGYDDTGTSGKLIVGIQREAHMRQKPEDARDPDGSSLVEAAVRFAGQGVCALGLVCDEFSHPPEIYRKAFDAIRDSELCSIPHAGEMGDDVQRSKNVRTAVTQLRAHRIGHGIPVGGDDSLMRLLKAKNVALELNPLSNLLAGFINDIRELHIDRLLENGITVSLNSDDPALFRTTLSQVYETVLDVYGWGEEHMLQFVRNAFASTCLSPEAAYKLNQHFLAEGISLVAPR